MADRSGINVVTRNLTFDCGQGFTDADAEKIYQTALSAYNRGETVLSLWPMGGLGGSRLPLIGQFDNDLYQESESALGQSFAIQRLYRATFENAGYNNFRLMAKAQITDTAQFDSDQRPTAKTSRNGLFELIMTYHQRLIIQLESAGQISTIYDSGEAGAEGNTTEYNKIIDIDISGSIVAPVAGVGQRQEIIIFLLSELDSATAGVYDNTYVYYNAKHLVGNKADGLLGLTFKLYGTEV